ncbi:MAG: RSP_7527 family protein [Marinomonas foliarum]|jgi:hypothetical protein|uniref:Uncharacterized protein n=1 Tax=Marinomonas foliarum TaxID=491950 RepID=A0A369A9D7_9GAMM|nr:hypothetical protein [Marinomonas foliarum]QRV25285.1 hypothetical protein JSY38_07170 [Marinomonas foliarum]RCX04697.1 hypothetical protein DFP77_11163 [Marinomonas foliarum]
MNNDLKYDAFGNLDADYYVEKAYELRRAYLSSAMKSAVVNLKAFFANLASSRTLKSAPQH